MELAMPFDLERYRGSGRVGGVAPADFFQR